MRAHRRRLLRRRPPPRHARRRSSPSPGAVVGLALFVGTMSVVTASNYALPPVVASAESVESAAAPGPDTISIPGPPVTAAPVLLAAAPSSTLPTRTVPRVAPVRMAVASLGITSPLVALGLHTDGTLEVPDDYRLAGWYTGGAYPGEAGPAVIAGHVDSRVGPGVFAKLSGVRIGETVEVTRADGVRLRFRITKVARYSKAAFPSAEVYGPTAQPELRLITCGGGFDPTTHSYEDNVVVFATSAGA